MRDAVPGTGRTGTRDGPELVSMIAARAAPAGYRAAQYRREAQQTAPALRARMLHGILRTQVPGPTIRIRAG